jgi:lipopolysaccharide assembly outer membrane protein LptD (OstA)
VATGNAVFLRGEERIAGDKLDMDLDTGHGTFIRALGYVQPGVFVEADSIERLDPEHYRIEGGRFTSCSQPNPRWGFTASSAKVHVDDKIVAKNVLFKVKSVPSFYLPYFVYPIKEDQRSTGLLFPHFGYSTFKGYNVGGGFFWAMGRSSDQTFYADHYSRYGYGYGHEFRYKLDAPSSGSFKSYAFRPDTGGDLDYDLDWAAIQSLPGKLKASVSVRRYSNLSFQQRFQDSLNQASIRTRKASVSVQRSLGSTTLQLIADSNETFFGEDQTRTTRHLPSLRVTRFPRKLGRSAVVFGFNGEASHLGRGDGTVENRYARFDAAPSLSVPFGNTFLQVTPTALVRYTRYGASLDNGTFTRSPLERRYFEGDIDVRGPQFAKVFSNPGKWYSDKFKHVIGPEVTFRYRTPVEDFTSIPKFDYLDQYLGTSQVDYGVVQRFFAKRSGPGGGKAIPYEFLNWRVGQTYYVKIKDSQNEFDPNYSSAIFGPGGSPDHNSPLQSRLRFRPTPQLTANFDVEYDVNFKQVRTLGVSTSVNTTPFTLQAGWSRAAKLAIEPTDRTPLRNTLRGSGKIEVWPSHLTLEGSVDYDVIQKNLFHSSARLEYNVQCCGFSVETLRYRFNNREEKLFRFSIQLANIGSIGNFLGDTPGAGAAGYR